MLTRMLALLFSRNLWLASENTKIVLAAIFFEFDRFFGHLTSHCLKLYLDLNRWPPIVSSKWVSSPSSRSWKRRRRKSGFWCCELFFFHTCCVSSHPIMNLIISRTLKLTNLRGLLILKRWLGLITTMCFNFIIQCPFIGAYPKVNEYYREFLRVIVLLT